MNFGTKANPLSIVLNDRDQLPASLAFHENIIKGYLQNSKLETVLIAAFRKLFKQDSLLPKNPFFRLVRSLHISNSQKEIIDNFEKVINLFKKTPTRDPPNRQYDISTIGDKESVWGHRNLLEWVDPMRIEKLRFSLVEVLPDFETAIGDFNVRIVHTLGGGHIFKSEVLEHPDSSSRPLEIAAEVFLSGEGSIEAKMAFANFVYDDVISLTNAKDLHLFKGFVFHRWDEEKEMKKKVWSLKEMITGKSQFCEDIKNNLNKVAGKIDVFYLRVLIKGKMIDYTKNLEDYAGFKPNGPDRKENYFVSSEIDGRFQYFDVFKFYDFHFIDLRNNGAKQSFEAQPMSSLLKRVFFTRETAQLYASFFQKPNENYTVSDHFTSFVQKQLGFILKGWKTQNMLKCAWDIFYLAILVENNDLRKELTDNILQIIASSLAFMISNTRLNKTLISLLGSYQNSTLLFFRGVCMAYFEIYRQQLEKILASGKNSDIIRFRGYIYDRMKDMTDKKTGQISLDSTSVAILKNIANIIAGIAESELQSIAIFMSDFPDYIFETLKKNNMILSESPTLTFEELIAKKEPKYFLDVGEEVEEMVETGTYGSKDPKYLENLFIASYVNEYELFDTLYYFFRDLFFGVQVPNPLPGLIGRMEMQALKYDLFETNMTQIKDVLINPLTEENQARQNNRVLKNVYYYGTNQMKSLNIPEIVSVEKIVKLTAAQEAGSLRLYLSNFDWKNSLTKSPPTTYQITDIFSVSGASLLNNTVALKRAYIEWTVSWDFIFKGATIGNAAQIFAFILIKYAIWLQQSTEVMVIGFFTDKDKENPAFDIDFILNNLENNKPREKLLNLYEGDSRVFLRIISRLESRFKNILIYFNMQFLDADSIKPQSLLKKNHVDNFLRVLFAVDDYVIWSKLFPFKQDLVCNLLEENSMALLKTGMINSALKMKYIKLLLEEADNVAMTVGRVFFSLSEAFFNFEKEAETLIFLFKTLEAEKQKKNYSNNEAKLTILQIQPFYSDFSEKLKEALLEYSNIYVEGIGMKIFYCLDELSHCFSGEYPLISVLRKLGLIRDGCRLMSKSLLLTLKQLVKEEFDYNIL